MREDKQMVTVASIEQIEDLYKRDFEKNMISLGISMDQLMMIFLVAHLYGLAGRGLFFGAVMVAFFLLRFAVIRSIRYWFNTAFTKPL